MSDFYEYDRDAALDQIMEWEEEREMEKYYAQQWEEYYASCETDMQPQDDTALIPVSPRVLDGLRPNSSGDSVAGRVSSEDIQPSDQENLKSPENLAVDDLETLETDAEVDENSDDPSHRQAELAWAQLLQASLVDRRSLEFRRDVANVVETSYK